jgi:hypothetical protein
MYQGGRDHRHDQSEEDRSFLPLVRREIRHEARFVNERDNRIHLRIVSSDSAFCAMAEKNAYVFEVQRYDVHRELTREDRVDAGARRYAGFRDGKFWGGLIKDWREIGLSMMSTWERRLRRMTGTSKVGRWGDDLEVGRIEFCGLVLGGVLSGSRRKQGG